jgi:tetratricopeptide (TPR) repeat protein
MSAYDYVNEGNSRYNNQNYTQAIVSYQNAVSLQPDMPAAYYNLGLSYCALGDYSKAVENFKKAAKREDNDTNFQKSATYYCLGWAYNQLNDKERALSCLNYTFIMYNDDYAKKAKELMQTIKSNRYSISSRTSSYDDNLRKAQQRQQAVRRVLEASRYNVY